LSFIKGNLPAGRMLRCYGLIGAFFQEFLTLFLLVLLHLISITAKAVLSIQIVYSCHERFVHDRLHQSRICLLRFRLFPLGLPYLHSRQSIVLTLLRRHDCRITPFHHLERVW